MQDIQTAPDIARREKMTDRKSLEEAVAIAASHYTAAYDQYFIPVQNTTHGTREPKSFVIFSAYDNSVATTYSGNSIPRPAARHA